MNSKEVKIENKELENAINKFNRLILGKRKIGNDWWKAGQHELFKMYLKQISNEK